ncbi:disulfide bond formation protein B [Swingsia samuiensis]|uniref:Disulfide bond formation protein B n=1 Tax=Swingsia samuiensis TaxID=1293412 RepID=A0A4Y6UHA2_9PROT|nr:disulfide bond formation protein B [Swingsia samuiensis]QDH16953.1 disulfide bond formation protein B [Swingsia samuiensis]
MKLHLDTKKFIGIWYILASIFALGIVYWAEHYLHLAPCELCLWERWPWRVLILLGVVSFIAPRKYAKYPVALGLVCLLVSVGLAILHAGVEHKLWASPASECRAPVFKGGSFKDWMAAMPARPNKPCDSPDYLFGLPISMTETGGLYACFVFVIAFLKSKKLFRN